MLRINSDEYLLLRWRKRMRFMKKWFKFEGGQSIVLVAFAIAMLCGVAALVVDTGMVSVAQGQLQNAADAAALAAANELYDQRVGNESIHRQRHQHRQIDLRQRWHHNCGKLV